MERDGMSGDGAPVLRVRGLGKTFVGRSVLRNVDLEVGRGEIVGLLGQNGSGKSTLIKVVSGYHEPDPGSSIEINGLDLQHPQARLQMAFVHQNLGLFDDLSVIDNMMVNRWARESGHLRWGRLRSQAAALLDDFGLRIGLDERVGGLSQGDRAVLAIARAVGELAHSSSGLLVLDEPTPYLARDEVARLFAAMRAAATRGIGILFVSHRLDEVRQITDRVLVIRDGGLVADEATAGLSDERLIELIVGRELSSFYPEAADRPVTELLLSVEELETPGGVRLDLELRKGEIVGLTGLLGSGFEQVPYALAGASNDVSGELAMDGTRMRLSDLDTAGAIASGLVLVPADRARYGVAGGLSVEANTSLPWIDRLSRRGRIDRRRELREVAGLLDRFDVHPRDPKALIETLSGGNQQKTVLARWIANHPRVLLLHEPTQGVDVGARTQIFSVLREIADQGISVLFCSLEYEDLAHMCDRVLVFRDGLVVSELDGAEVTVDRIVDTSMRAAA